jgi:hypothetical protein
MSVPAISAVAYTTTLLVMVDRMKGGGRAPPPSPCWADFTIMMECTTESGHCRSAYSLWEQPSLYCSDGQTP